MKTLREISGFIVILLIHYLDDDDDDDDDGGGGGGDDYSNRPHMHSRVQPGNSLKSPVVC